MDQRDWLAQRFEEQRPRLRGVAYRMLGSLAEADDALARSYRREEESNVSSRDRTQQSDV
jgi:DNA-directed RNA polymerase specialized sigma24 family protein